MSTKDARIVFFLMAALMDIRSLSTLASIVLIGCVKGGSGDLTAHAQNSGTGPTGSSPATGTVSGGATGGKRPVSDASLPVPASNSDAAAVEATIPPSPTIAGGNPYAVLPVFVVPSDMTLTPTDEAWATDRIDKHLRLAQNRYLELLKTDTFRKLDAAVYHAKLPLAAYQFPDAGDVVIKELLDWKGVDRFSSTYVFLVFVVRTEKDYEDNEKGINYLGFGGTLNGGPPMSGSGYVFFDFGELRHDTQVPLQSSIQHELGHAFGLNHVDCHGYDQSNNPSMMSYTLSQWAFGLQLSKTPGAFIAEDFFVLDKNKGAFPKFHYDPAVHNPSGAPLQKIDECYLGPESAVIGDASGSTMGYRLYFDGQLSSGPDAIYYSYGEAKANCAAMIASYPQTKVRCAYNGVDFAP